MMAALGMMVPSCANIGTPEGGAIDYTPPVFVKSSPAQGAVSVKGNKVEIIFNEIVNIKDQQKRVSVSPVQKDPPIIKAMGKKVTVEFRDEMKPNTTYSIDFSNAIEDNNEGNPLDGFSFAFSTGEDIDSLQISGVVLRARDLEPMQHTIVGLHSNLEDSALTSIPFERMCRTNDRGQFTLRNIKPGRYHVFALNDMDGNYRMARTEDVAFLDEVIVPSASRFESQDTVFTFDNKVDTIVTGLHTQYLPNDLLLSMFNENFRSVYLKTTSRPQQSRLHVLMSAPSPELPTMRIIKPEKHAADWCVVEHTPSNDSLFYWISDSALIKSDSIVVAMDYLRTDSTDNLSHKTDTITFAFRKSGTQIKQEAQEKKEKEQLAKRLASLRDKQAKGKNLNEEELELLNKGVKVEIPKLEINFPAKGNINVYDTLFVDFPTPVASIDQSGVHLDMKRDSLWIELGDVPALRPVDTGSVLHYMLPMEFDPDSTYRLRIDSLAITSIYALHNDSTGVEFKVKDLSEYANLTVHVNVDGNAFIDLVDGQDHTVRSVPVRNGVADFENLPPATYFLRLVIDSNGNGVWDTGNYVQHLQPEEVYYYPKRLKLRKNWDVEETWDIYATALDMQKHPDILHNKPEDRKSKLFKNKDRNKRDGQDDEDEEDEFNSKAFGNGVYSGNKYQDYQNSRR